MQSVRQQLTEMFSEVFQSLGLEARFGHVTVSDRPDLAQFQCNGALACAKTVKRNPREVAQQILAAAQSASEKKYGAGAISFSIAGPGFINLIISDDGLARQLAPQLDDARLGVPVAAQAKTIVVDYGGPNIAKGMHVGHLRSAIIGDSIVRTHRFLGHHVIGDNHVGDWGTQMGMLICELKERQPTLPYFDSVFSGEYPPQAPVTLADLEEMYPKASQRYEADAAFKADVQRATDELQSGRRGYKALWRHFVSVTIADLKRDYAHLGIVFDKWLGESFYEDRMPAMVEKLKNAGQTVLSEGALAIALADENDPEMPPLILIKSNGGFLYHTSDMATCEYRAQELHADVALNVVDKRQTLHFQQVFKAVRKTGLGGKCDFRHLPFGTMNGTDGKPFRTRAGGTLKLKDVFALIDGEAKKRLAEQQAERPYSSEELGEIAHRVGVATLKFADLKHARTTDYVFDLEKFSKFEGYTGPYLLYAAVRIKSILRKAAEQGFKPATGFLAPSSAPERALILELFKFPDVVQTTAQEGEPHHLCEYGYAVSQAFNSFLAESHILRESDRERQGSWLALARLCHDHLELVLSLLGIAVPERM